MNFRKNLRKNSLLIFLGICLIFIGFLIVSSKKVEVIQPENSSAIPITTATPSATFAKVIRVIDGDTIVIEGGQKVRYIGINTPEVETSECFATEASQINNNLVLGKVVKLEKDISETDKYGRLLRYVYLNDEMINDELVKEGSARIETVPPDVEFRNQFLESQKYAKENNLGLWGRCP